jgi:pSer/pThr/pTyr-binding forkhead associated (FHA) protein
MEEAARATMSEFDERFPGFYMVTQASDSGEPSRELSSSLITLVEGLAGPRKRGVLDVARVQKRHGANRYASMITLGRARDNDLLFNDISVSKMHAWIRRTDAGGWSITDAGSRNGTFVNATRVGREPHPLPVDATVRLGLVELRFVDGLGLFVTLRGATTDGQAAR